MFEDIIDKLNEVLNVVDRYDIHYESKFNALERNIRYLSNNKVKVVYSGNVGRPSIVIDEEQIAGLRSLRMSWTKIAELLGISVETLRRKRQSFHNPGLSYVDMSDNELDDVVLDLLRKHLCSGERLLQGHLLSNGHLIQRARVRESMNRIDRSNRFLMQEKSFEGPTMCLDQTISGRYLFICKILHSICRTFSFVI